MEENQPILTVNNLPKIGEGEVRAWLAKQIDTADLGTLREGEGRFGSGVLTVTYAVSFWRQGGEITAVVGRVEA